MPDGSYTTTCDIYRGNPPGSSDIPAATNVPVQITPDFDNASGQLLKPWVFILTVGPNIDIRDGYAGFHTSYNTAGSDTVVIPSSNDPLKQFSTVTNTKYTVTFVEYFNTNIFQKRAYVDRLTPSWPTL